ncbi:MAG TPA: iron chelate uptake ABC transporter family permease subunit [Pseudolabrys sp.]|nr:iron chelate uptake ABC transporter family permease subunit [Pseudolabrys sp.]
MTGTAVSTSAQARRRAAAADVWLFPGLLLLLILAAIVAAGIGAAGIPLSRLPAALGLATSASDPVLLARDQLVLWSIRLPRIAMAGTIGALLAAGGTIMQGLFRNPLADPALVGVSSGGALAAAATIVIGDRLLSGIALPFEMLPAAAFIGALATTLLLHAIATTSGRTSVAVFLLAGLAISALAGAALGLLVFIADDRQLRDITFWMLGSLGGATWNKAAVLTPFLLALLVLIPAIARGLDLMVLGEAEAFHMGVEVERLKRLSIVLVSAMTGAAVSFAGVIGFVGIVVPHLLRLAIGPGHRRLLPASACAGAILLLLADTAARTLAAPAEVPIGVLTALVGAPFFLVLLLRQRGLVGL